MDDLFARTRLLLGQDGLDRLAAARVAVFGVGGVGGYVVEALARSGVGALDLIDSDTVDATNLNRQIIATVDAIGRSKVEVAAERVASINPSCVVRAHQCFFLPETAGQFDFAAFDYVVDAVDTVSAKIALVEAAFAARVPIVSSMGAGNKLDPTAFRVADVYETSVDPLARVMLPQKLLSSWHSVVEGGLLHRAAARSPWRRWGGEERVRARTRARSLSFPRWPASSSAAKW